MRRAAIILFLALALCPIPRSRASRAEISQPQPQYNFLFILDTSISMASRKSSVAILCRDMIASGFYGQIGAGDSIDIWTYDTTTHLNEFPPQIWSTNRSEEIAATTASFISKKKFKGRSRFLGVEQDLHSLLPNTKGLMVFLITDGDETLSGTGFDSEINPQLARVKRQLPGTSEPFLVTLMAVDGKFKDWRIFGGHGRPLLPSLPPRHASAPEQMIASAEPEEKSVKPFQGRVERIQTVSEPRQKAVEPEKERFHQQTPVVFNFPPGANVITPPPAVAPAPAPIVSAPNPVHAMTNTVATTLRTNTAVAEKPVIGASNSVAASAVPARTVQKPIAEQSPALAVTVMAKGEPAVALKAVVNPVKTSAPEVASNSAASEISRQKITFAAAGGGGAMCLLLGITLFSRRNRPKKEPSLISKSLGR